jgi:hypothetical protein
MNSPQFLELSEKLSNWTNLEEFPTTTCSYGCVLTIEVNYSCRHFHEKYLSWRIRSMLVDRIYEWSKCDIEAWRFRRLHLLLVNSFFEKFAELGTSSPWVFHPSLVSAAGSYRCSQISNLIVEHQEFHDRQARNVVLQLVLDRWIIQDLVKVVCSFL